MSGKGNFGGGGRGLSHLLLQCSDHHGEQEPEAAGHIMLTVRKPRESVLVLSLLSPFCSLWYLNTWSVLPNIQAYFCLHHPFSGKPFWKHPHGHTQRCFHGDPQLVELAMSITWGPTLNRTLGSSPPVQSKHPPPWLTHPRPPRSLPGGYQFPLLRPGQWLRNPHARELEQLCTSLSDLGLSC